MIKVDKYQRVIFKNMLGEHVRGVVTYRSKDNNNFKISCEDGREYGVPLKNILEIL